MLQAETVAAQTQPTRNNQSSRAKRPRITALDQHLAPAARVERTRVTIATTRTGCPKNALGSGGGLAAAVKFIVVKTSLVSVSCDTVCTMPTPLGHDPVNLVADDAPGRTASSKCGEVFLTQIQKFPGSGLAANTKDRRNRQGDYCQLSFREFLLVSVAATKLAWRPTHCCRWTNLSFRRGQSPGTQRLKRPLFPLQHGFRGRGS